MKTIKPVLVKGIMGRKGALHGMSYYQDPTVYTEKVGAFVAKYMN